MSRNVGEPMTQPEDLSDLQRSDEDLMQKAALIKKERSLIGLDGLVGGLQAVIINTEQELQKPAVQELVRYSGLAYHEAFIDSTYITCVLKAPDSRKFRSADFLIRSRLKGTNPFKELNLAPRSRSLPNTRLETFVFETNDIERYVSLQKSNGVEFQSKILDCSNYLFIQTTPSLYTGNSLGFIQWKAEKGDYFSTDSERLDWTIEKPKASHLKNIRWLDHAATRVKAHDRDNAIMEFMRLTNYDFEFSIYVESLNSITSVARLSQSDFAMVITSGIAPYVSMETSGPTEKFIQNYGPRVHHIAFQTEEIEETTKTLEKDGMKYLLDLVGSPEEGLKQIFSVSSPNTLIVTEYIHRYRSFDGFFTKSNVKNLTAATYKQ